jgi:8-oxo-dGTP diphosphatase
MSFTYKYPHPAVTVDSIIFALHEHDLKVLLIQRKSDPYKDRWALPGGFVDIDEGIEEAARRELWEETGVENVFLEQLYTFGDPKRDPRERVITIAYYSLVRLSEHTVRAASDALNACWFGIRQLPNLAFDHAKILEIAIKRLQGKVLYAPIIFELLPDKFEIDELQKLYEIILERPLDRADFRKSMLNAGILAAVGDTSPGTRKPLLQYYKFDRLKYKKLQDDGIGFELKPGPTRKTA